MDGRRAQISESYAVQLQLVEQVIRNQQHSLHIASLYIGDTKR